MPAGTASAPAGPVSAPGQTRSIQPSVHLAISGTQFRTSDGGVWPWRGITAFRLLEQLSAGQVDAVERYLAWAAGEKLTVVRVLAMARHLFELPPARGRAHLDDLLTRAARHGLYVEIVPLADTASFEEPMAAQVREVAAIAARHPNALVEIANEPYHHTQRREIQTLPGLSPFLKLVPESVPTAVGAFQDFDDAAAGDYVTFHFPRASGQQGWGHVLQLAEGHGALQRLRKPLINDEPIGAGAILQPGRRDDNPDRMRAAALLTRMTGMGATFHYEGGLQARIPEGQERLAFDAWQEAWSHLPVDVESEWRFRFAGAAGAATRQVMRAAGAWEIQRGDTAWLLVVAPDAEPSVSWSEGWREAQAISWAGSQLRRAVRRGP